MNAGGSVEQLLRQVSPGRFDTYEALLNALAEADLWMLLWTGQPGAPTAQYGNMEVAGFGYAPCVTSGQQLTASGWNRAHEVVAGRDIAAALFPDHWGIWLNPHAPGGGVGIPWLDLRRIAGGLDRLPAGPLDISEHAPDVPDFYAQLAQSAQHTPAVRALHSCWVQPALGQPYLAIGLDLYDGGEQSVQPVREMMQRALGAVPAGLPVSSVSMADDYDPVTMWLRRNSRPFFDRAAPAAAAAPQGAVPGYGYPRPY